MSNNLNQGASIEAEQAAFEKATVFGAFAYAKDEFGVYIEEKTRNYFNGWQAARRTPAAATGAAPSVKTWQERIPDVGTHKDVREAMQAEIADLRAQLAAALDASTRQNIAATAVWKERDALRAQLAAKGQGEPVAWGVMENGKLIHTSYHKRSAADWLKYNEARTLVDLYLAAPASAQPADPPTRQVERWRDLALQFDGHRMQALHHLKAMLQDPAAHAPLAAEFLSAPPLSGEKVLAQRLKALAELLADAPGAGAQPDQQESAAFAHVSRGSEEDQLRSIDQRESAAVPEEDRDPLYEKAVQVVRAHNRASLSLVQRTLVLGHNRTARLFEAMEKEGVVSACDASGHRTVLAASPAAQPVAKDEQDAPKCWCHTCNKDRMVGGWSYAMTTMILCPTCGNKRCPKATNHALACTNSNEPGQPGSVYGEKA